MNAFPMFNSICPCLPIAYIDSTNYYLLLLFLILFPTCVLFIVLIVSCIFTFLCILVRYSHPDNFLQKILQFVNEWLRVVVVSNQEEKRIMHLTEYTVV